MSPSVILYTRAGCHLCDDVKSELGRLGIAPTEVDVDSSAELRALHGHWVPVVEFDGKIRFRGRVDPILLRRCFREC